MLTFTICEILWKVRAAVAEYQGEGVVEWISLWLCFVIHEIEEYPKELIENVFMHSKSRTILTHLEILLHVIGFGDICVRCI